MSGAALEVRCPAKVNLALRVLARRADGYHELDTVFQAVDLWDVVEIAPARELSLTCDDPSLPTDSRNLVLRAAELVCETVGRSLGGALRLRKTIPAQAGLGGGSSDAAGALRLCCRFWGLELPAAVESRLAAELGADVPFFLHGGTARGTGRGDRIEALPPVRALHLLLGCPPFGVSTAEVFRRVADRLTLPGNGVNLPVLSAHKWPKDNDFGFFSNDLEPIVFDGWPGLSAFRDALLEVGAVTALLSGSGSTVYGIFRSERQQVSALDRLRSRFGNWKIIPTVSVDQAVRLAERSMGASDEGS